MPVDRRCQSRPARRLETRRPVRHGDPVLIRSSSYTSLDTLCACGGGVVPRPGDPRFPLCASRRHVRSRRRERPPGGRVSRGTTRVEPPSDRYGPQASVSRCFRESDVKRLSLGFAHFEGRAKRADTATPSGSATDEDPGPSTVSPVSAGRLRSQHRHPRLRSNITSSSDPTAVHRTIVLSICHILIPISSTSTGYSSLGRDVYLGPLEPALIVALRELTPGWSTISELCRRAISFDRPYRPARL